MDGKRWRERGEGRVILLCLVGRKTRGERRGGQKLHPPKSTNLHPSIYRRIQVLSQFELEKTILSV